MHVRARLSRELQPRGMRAVPARAELTLCRIGDGEGMCMLALYSLGTKA